MSIFTPGSFCPSCKTPLKWYENIPLISYFFLRGKCGHCGVKIPLKYPLIEFFTAFIFVLFFLKFGLEKTYFFYIIIVGYLIVLSVIDLHKKEVPDVIILCFLLTGFIFASAEIGNVNIYNGIIGALAGAFIIYLLNFLSNGKIGEGDIKLILCLGLCLGLRNVLGIILYAFIIGGIVSVALILFKRRSRKEEIAFVPFIAAAFLVESLVI